MKVKAQPHRISRPSTKLNVPKEHADTIDYIRRFDIINQLKHCAYTINGKRYEI